MNKTEFNKKYKQVNELIKLKKEMSKISKSIPFRKVKESIKKCLEIIDDEINNIIPIQKNVTFYYGGDTYKIISAEEVSIIINGEEKEIYPCKHLLPYIYKMTINPFFHNPKELARINLIRTKNNREKFAKKRRSRSSKPDNGWANGQDPYYEKTISSK